MGLLSTAEIAEIKRNLLSLMETPITVQRLIESSDGAGGIHKTWSSVGSTNAFLGSKTIKQIDIGGKGTYESVWDIALPSDCNIEVRNHDRIKTPSRTFIVVNTNIDETFCFYISLQATELAETDYE